MLVVPSASQPRLEMRLVLVPVLYLRHKRPDAFSAVPLVVGGNAETQWHPCVVCRSCCLELVVAVAVLCPDGFGPDFEGEGLGAWVNL